MATLDSLGCAHHHLGDYANAIAYLNQAHALASRLSALPGVAETLVHLGDAHHAAGDERAARQHWQQGLELLIRLDHPHAHGVSLKIANLERTG